MAGLSLANPKMMDVAVPANLSIGQRLATDPDILSATVTVENAIMQLGDDAVLFIDLRETRERQITGIIPGSLHTPYLALKDAIEDGGLLNAMVRETGKSLMLYCAFGERSALALQILKQSGFEKVAHLSGGMAAWTSAGAPTEPSGIS